MHKKSRPLAPWWGQVILWLALVFLFLPLSIMGIGSFLDEGGFTLRWYLDILSDSLLLEALQRSFIIGLVSSVCATALGTAAALAIAKTHFRWKQILNSFSLLSMVLPELVFALSLLSWFVMIQFSLSLVTVFMAHVTFSLAFSIFIIGSRLAQMDAQLEEAAWDLGASPWVELWKVTLPLIRPSILGSMIICFLLSFDDFLISYFVSGVGADTLPIKLYTSMKLGHSPKLNALAALMMVMSLASVGLLFSSRSIRSAISR